MKKSLILCSIFAVSVLSSRADLRFADNFNSYANGNLAGLTQDTVGQGSWRQTGTAATTPVQVNSGTAVLGTSGQDVYAPLTSAITLTAGDSFYIGAVLTVTAAQSVGDYFLHYSSPAGTTTIFQERFFIKSSGAGFVFGYDGSSGGTVNYSSTVLNLNTAYTIVLKYTAVAGTVNDTFALYVNPTDAFVEGNNTAYMTSAYIGTGAESATVSAINLRQGSAANAPSVVFDKLLVGTSFVDAIPEPSSIAMAALGGFAMLGITMRRNRK